MHLLFSSQAVGTFLIPEIDFHQPNGYGENIAEQTVNLGYILWPKLDPVRRWLEAVLFLKILLGGLHNNMQKYSLKYYSQ